jgi:predicted Zn finger-like uncharacterized protein
MIIECPECGKRGKVDASKIPEAGVYAKCSGCGTRITVKRTGVVRQPEPPAAPAPPSPTVPPLGPDASLTDPVTSLPGAPPTKPPSAPGMQPPATDAPGGQGYDGGFAQPVQRPVKEDKPVPPVQAERKRVLENDELVALAKKNLQGKWGLAIFIGFVFMVITGVVSSVDFTGGLISLAIAGPMTLGFCAFYLDIAQGQRPDVSRIFFGFSRFFDALIAYLVVLVMIILWSLLLIIPGVIAAMSYSMTFFILADEPQTGALDAWRKSKQLMKGNRAKLFWLPLRIGWLPILVWTVVVMAMTIPTILGGGTPPPFFIALFIAVFVIGMIGFVWFYIFITAAIAQFYENIKDQ